MKQRSLLPNLDNFELDTIFSWRFAIGKGVNSLEVLYWWWGVKLHQDRQVASFLNGCICDCILFWEELLVVFGSVCYESAIADSSSAILDTRGQKAFKSLYISQMLLQSVTTRILWQTFDLQSFAQHWTILWVSFLACLYVSSVFLNGFPLWWVRPDLLVSMIALRSTELALNQSGFFFSLLPKVSMAEL